MKDSSSAQPGWINVVRWTARVISLLLILLTLVFMVAEGLSNDRPAAATLPPIINIIVGILMLGGLALAWKWEFIGALISLLGFIGILVVNPNVLTKPMMYLFAIPSILFLLCWGVGRSLRSDERTVSPLDT